MEAIIQTDHLGVKLHPIKWGHLACKEDWMPCPSEQRHGLDFSPYSGEVGHCSLCMVQSYGMAVAMRRKFWPHKVTLMRYCDSGVLLVATGLSDQLDSEGGDAEHLPPHHKHTGRQTHMT